MTSQAHPVPAVISEINNTPVIVLERLMTTSPAKADWFASAFLQQVPLATLESILTQIRQLGTYQSIEITDGGYLILLSEVKIPTQIQLNEVGQITTLLFQPPIPNDRSLDALVQDLETWPGQISFLVTKNGETLYDLNADQPLAVASTFKLAVLAALDAEITAGKRQWSDVVHLEPQWRSLPTGILQDWGAGSPITLHTLATLMISISDNTATDGLISILGREKIEALIPSPPLLTTREAFILKDPVNQSLQEQYRQGTREGRRQLLPSLQTLSLPSVDIFTGQPIAPDIEWFFTTQQLCQLMSQVSHLPPMQVNPGLAKPQDWQQVAFKGGSEPGIMNLTTAVVSNNGDQYCLSLTWNHNQPLNEIRMTTFYGSVIDALKRLSVFNPDE